MPDRSQVAELISTWFFVGKIKWAPGTWGTLATVPLSLFLHYWGPFFQMGFTLLLFPLALWAVENYEKTLGSHDSSEIVVDEVLGFLITMTWLPLTWQSYVIGFALFRALDILKPFPISYFDKHVKGGIGVIADDVVAGIIASVILQYIYFKTALLGMQWLA